MVCGVKKANRWILWLDTMNIVEEFDTLCPLLSFEMASIVFSWVKHY